MKDDSAEIKCIFVGTGVICTPRQRENCYRCGFNPAVKERRLKKLRERRPDLV